MANLNITGSLASTLFDAEGFLDTNGDGNPDSFPISLDSYGENIDVRIIPNGYDANENISGDIDLTLLEGGSFHARGIADGATITANSDTRIWLEGTQSDENRLTIDTADIDNTELDLVMNGSFIGAVTDSDGNTVENGEDFDAASLADQDQLNIVSEVDLGENVETLNVEVQSDLSDDVALAGDVDADELLSDYSSNDLISTLDIENAENLETINVSGVRTFSMTVAGALTALETIDASALNARAIIDATDSNSELDITGSSRGDIITLGESDNVDAGAGNDVVYVNDTARANLDGGAGRDDLRIGPDAEDIDVTSLGNADYSYLNRAQNFERVTLYSDDGDTVAVDAAQLDNFNTLRFAEADPVRGEDNNGDALDIDVTNASADQVVYALDGGTLTLAAADDAEAVTVEANFLNDGSESRETLLVDGAEGESLTTLNLQGDGRVAYAGVDQTGDETVATIDTIDASNLTGGLTYQSIAGVQESITLADTDENGVDVLAMDEDSSNFGIDGDLIDSVENFDVDADTLLVGADVALTAADVLSVDVSAAGSQVEAFRIAADAVSADGVSEGYAGFEFGDSTWIYGNTSEGTSGNLDSADFALELEGDIDLSGLADHRDMVGQNFQNDNDQGGRGSSLAQGDFGDTDGFTDGLIEVTGTEGAFTGTNLQDDSFNIASGDSTITGFEDGFDTIDLSDLDAADGSSLEFSDLAISANDEDAANTDITFTDGNGDSSITLVGVDVGDISVADFNFA